MRSPYTTIPAVTVTRTGTGWLVSCTCGFTAERVYQINADLLARDHLKRHGTPIGEQE